MSEKSELWYYTVKPLCRRARIGKLAMRYIAWATRRPCDDLLDVDSDAFVEFGATRAQALSNLKKAMAH